MSTKDKVSKKDTVVVETVETVVETKVNKTSFIKKLYIDEGIKDNAEVYARCQEAGIEIDKRNIANIMWAIRKPEDMVERVSVADDIRVLLKEDIEMTNKDIYSKLRVAHPEKNRKYVVDTAWRLRREIRSEILKQIEADEKQA